MAAGTSIRWFPRGGRSSYTRTPVRIRTTRPWHPTRTLDGHWLETLNAPQREAVTHGAGPLLVVAGAGTGKTWTLACRVARLIDDGVPPQRILLLTFSRRAAREMLSRAERLLHGRPPARPAVWGGTFHAVANRLLRLYARPLGPGARTSPCSTRPTAPT